MSEEKSKKVLTDLLNEYIEKNESLYQENEALN